MTHIRSVLATLRILALAGPAVAHSRANDREKHSACTRTDSCATLSRADRENLSARHEPERPAEHR